ncbi:TetR/AcrR family transcriptional regulator [Endozoicomonadaceae bacterium StTr2]
MRHKIIQATIHIVGNEGYSALTASRLSKEAGISKGALYHHFDGLDGVRQATLEMMVEAFMTACDASQFDNLADYLEKTGQTILALVREQPDFTRVIYAFMYQSMFDPQIKALTNQICEHATNDYIAAFEHFVPELSPAQRIDMVSMMDAFYSGLTVHLLLFENEAAVEKQWQLFNEMLLSYLKRGASK